MNVSAASSFGAAANASPIGGTNSTALNADNSNGFMWVYDYVNGGKTTVHYEATGENAIIGNCRLFNGVYNGSAAIDRLDLIRNTTNTLTGTLKLYGVS